MPAVDPPGTLQACCDDGRWSSARGSHLPLRPREQRAAAYSPRSTRAHISGRTTRGCRAFYADHVKGRLAQIWRSWRASAARDLVKAVLLTAVLLAGSYGEA